MITLQKKIRKYKDISFAFTRNQFSNQVNIKTDYEAIRQSVTNILLTRKGERGFDPEFGSPIANLLFENQSPGLAMVMRDEIVKCLDRYEPRLQVADVLVKFVDNFSVKIEIVGNIINVTDPITITVLVNRLR